MIFWAVNKVRGLLTGAVECYLQVRYVNK